MNPTRRQFIKHAIVAGVSLPLFNIGRAGVPAHSVIRHASFGASGMALNDIKSLARDPQFRLLAVAEVDDTRLGGLLELFPDVRIYKDWRVLLDKEHKNLDSVNVSTPDHMHGPIAVTAMHHGLNVYGQKPMAQNLHETRRMAEIAKETGVVTQMGIQLRSTTYERLAVRMIQDGVVGRVKEVHVFSHKTHGDPLPKPDRSDPVPPGLDWNLWCGVASMRPYIENYYHPGLWRRRLDFGTGTLGDMGCHLYSPMFGAMGLKAPLSVKSVGETPNATNWAINEKFVYTFPGNDFSGGKKIRVTWYDGAQRPPIAITEQFGEDMPDQGSIFVGSKGVLLQPHGGLPVPYPLDQYTDYRYPKFPGRDHYMDFLAAVRGENVSPLADFHQYAGPLTETVLLGCLASRFPGKKLKWDPDFLRVKNHDAANAFIHRQYRKGWDVDGLS